MEPISHVQKTYTKLKIAERPSDFAFWQAQPYELRLAALEEIRLEHDPAFLQRVERARQSLRAGRGVKLEDIKA